MKHLLHPIGLRAIARYVVLCTVVAGAVALTGCGGGSASSVPAATRFATSYAGNWSGNWMDIDSTMGTATMVIMANSSNNTASVALDLSGGKFGFVGSQSTLTGTFDSNGIAVAGAAGHSAMVSLTIDRAGQFTGSATNVSAATTRIDFSGPSTPQNVTMTVTVHHTDGTIDSGTITLTKQAV